MRLLFYGDASNLKSGFGIYHHNVMARLSKKFVLAELGFYSKNNSTSWRFFSDPSGNSSHAFNDAVRDFKPDVVISHLDPLQFAVPVESHLRNSYKLVLIPAIDSAPIPDDWLFNLKYSDKVLAISNYGKAELEKAKIKVDAIASPGVDLDVFKPLEKQSLKDRWKINSSGLIFGTVMRNQKRKLYKELFHTFLEFNKNKEHLLLCHTTYPDSYGINIPHFLKQYGSQTKRILFTYRCFNCNVKQIKPLIDLNHRGFGQCDRCKTIGLHMPSPTFSYSDEELCELYNLMDVYVQLSSCEGWGMPIAESRVCEVPGIYIDYSAMQDHLQNGGAIGLEAASFYQETTGQLRACPELDDIVNAFKRLEDGVVRENLITELKKTNYKYTWEGAVSSICSVLNC